MTQNELIKLLKKILATDTDLEFLVKLEPRELELLVASVRHRLDEVEK
jgi:hypothetical protein